MAYVYVSGSVNPISSIAAALHHSRGSWVAYQICLPIITIAAGLANLVILIGGIRIVSRSVLLSLLVAIVAFTPIWSPYAIEAALRKHLWNTECDGFDGTFFLDAAHYNQQPDLSVAQFPSSFGGQKWTLYQSSEGIYEFSPVGEDSQITFNFINETYSLHTNTTHEGGALTNTNVPLSFPQFGLSSVGGWIRSCFAPAVELTNSTGNVIIKTGLTAYTDCSQMEVCASKSMGINPVIVAIGRILVALENGAICCTRSRWG
jgi:hypothetical protein